ncbi:hypothetical protein SFC02_12825 [Terribacillus goriensis]|uniref:hypothetical protein n=1 Tax=Terribacillus saccharophilus TaxID=361277 RepID=UPI0039830D36
MDSKKVVFIVIGLIAILFLSFPYIKDAFLAKELDDSLILKSGEYEIGEDLPAGEYDFRVSGEITIQGKDYQDGAETKGIRLHKEELVSVEGNGEVEIFPTAKESLSKNEGGSYIISHSGNYEIGEQLESGLYEIQVQGDVGSEEEFPLIQILDESDTVKESISLENDKVVSLELKEGNYLQVEKSLMRELSEITIVLTKRK